MASAGGFMSATAPDRIPPRLSDFTAVVRSAIVETRAAKTLLLDPGAPAPYRAGQYVTIDPHQFAALQSSISHLEKAKGRREAPRAYSLSSAPGDPCVAVTVKEESYDAADTPYPPLLSGFLVHQLRVGDTVTLRGFVGSYTLTDDAAVRTDHVLHLCAGSGSVANFSILKDSLRRLPHLRHTFVYSNRTWEDVIFRDALRDLKARYPDRVQVIHRLTREAGPLPAEPDVTRGRIDLELLRTILLEHPQSPVFVCGPGISVREKRASAARGIEPAPRFIETMRRHLDTLGIARTQVKFESYG